MAPKPDSENPLAPLAKLSPSVYLQEPVNSTDNAGDYPKVIILAFWMNAPPRALAKYIVEYRLLAPSARIIVILSSSNDFIVNFTKSAQQARLAPAVEAIRASATPDSPVFLHMFSNGGVSSTTHLLATYQKTTGYALRISSMIIDSAPGKATLTASVKAFSYVLPKMWLLHYPSKFFLFVFLALGALVRKLTRRPSAVSIARDAINDRRLVHGPGQEDSPKRCYIYSDADELVNWKDVEEHASVAESKGWMVRREKFQGTPHVLHMRADPERYWNIVREYLRWPESQ